jgi:uncharacterized protein YndB with AHSA1/START domain
MRILAAIILTAALYCGAVGRAEAQAARQVIKEVTVDAAPAVIWRHWTTLEGLRTIFVSPTPPLEGRVELRPNGPYELYFLTENADGDQGTEESRIIAYQEERMLSFTWRNTPYWEIRPFFTHVIVTLEPVGENRTRVRLVQSGFGDGGEWDTAYSYFDAAWSRVLNRLVDRYGGVEVAAMVQ